MIYKFIKDESGMTNTEYGMLVASVVATGGIMLSEIKELMIYVTDLISQWKTVIR